MFALAFGAVMYYLQVYAFYDEVQASTDDVVLTSLVSGEPEPILYDNFQGIDADSSPVRYRACFDTPTSLALMTETYQIHDDAVPLVAPNWFDCFDADAIGADLESGVAIAFMGTENIQYGIDRIVAVYGDGRAVSWNQINACGEVAFHGDPVPAGCPTPPESLN